MQYEPYVVTEGMHAVACIEAGRIDCLTTTLFQLMR